MWIDAVTLGAGAFARPWRRSNDDFVFISYAWADDRQKRTVGALSDVLTRANVPHFLDRNAITSDTVKEFCTDWRVSEFHDGWGWGFQAYGGERQH